MLATPPIGRSGTELTVNGSGFAPSTSYTICFSSINSSCSSGGSVSVTASASGQLLTTVAASATASGLHYVLVLSGSSVEAITRFYVVNSSIALAPSSGPPGQIIGVSGSGFLPSTPFELCFSYSLSTCNGPESALRADANGNVPSGTTITPPSTTGAGTNYVLALIGPFVIASATFTVLDPTSTTIRCSSNQVYLNGKVNCTATVTDTSSIPIIPTGTVTFRSSGNGEFTPSASCSLIGGSCSITYEATAVGSQTINANYGADILHLPSSSNNFALSVVYNFGGFLPPLASNGNYTAGRTLPVKFQLTDANGNFVSTAVAHIFVDGQPGVASGSSNSGNVFRYDPTSNQYVFNLSTKGLSMGKHVITVVLDDGTTHSITINLVG